MNRPYEQPTNKRTNEAKIYTYLLIPLSERHIESTQCTLLRHVYAYVYEKEIHVNKKKKYIEVRHITIVVYYWNIDLS